MGKRTLPIVVLVVAVAGLVGSGAWAINHEGTSGGGWMHSRSTSWMMSYHTGSAAPVRSLADARLRAQAFADRLDLKVAEVMQFTNNYYARLDDTSGKAATEVLIDPATGNTSLEYGPAMMWNTRYGMMNGGARTGMMSGGMSNGSGMMGSAGGMTGSGSGMSGGGMMGSAGGPSWTPSAGSVSGPVSAQQAIKIADRWLAQRDASLKVPDADAFPGYYSMENRAERQDRRDAFGERLDRRDLESLVARPHRESTGLTGEASSRSRNE